MRFFAKIYANQEIDVVNFECDPATTTLRDVKRHVINLTNLDEKDTMRVIFRGVPLVNDEVSLWDLSAKENETAHIIVEKMADAEKTFRVLKDRQQFNVLREFTDQTIVNTFSFLDAKSMATVALVCRKWKNLSQQNQLLWRWNCSVEFTKDHASSNPISLSMGKETGNNSEEDSKDNGEEPSVLYMKGQHPFKEWLSERVSQRSKWQRVAKFTRDDFDTTRQTIASVVFKKGRALRVRKKPKELSKEEQKFLKDNDPKQLKRLLRKEKGAKEKLKKYRQLQKRNDEMESGVWRFIPEQYTAFEFDTIMNHAFGFPDDATRDGFEAKYESGRLFFTKNNQIIFLAELEPEDDKLRFYRIYVEEGAPDVFESEGNEQDLEYFFKLLSACGTRHDKVKEFVDVVEGDYQSVQADAAVIPRLIWADNQDALPEDALVVKKYEEKTHDGGVTVVLSPRSTQEQNYNGLLLSIDVPVFDSDAAKNEENLIQAYLNILASAMENEAIDTVAICSIESRINEHEDFSSAKEQITEGQWNGALYARACKKFIATRQSSSGNNAKKHAKTTSEAEALLSKELKEQQLMRSVLVVSNEEEFSSAKTQMTLELNKAE